MVELFIAAAGYTIAYLDVYPFRNTVFTFNMLWTKKILADRKIVPNESKLLFYCFRSELFILDAFFIGSRTSITRSVKNFSDLWLRALMEFRTANFRGTHFSWEESLNNGDNSLLILSRFRRSFYWSLQRPSGRSKDFLPSKVYQYWGRQARAYGNVSWISGAYTQGKKVEQQ